MKPLSPHDLIDLYQCTHRVGLKKAIKEEKLSVSVVNPEQVTLDLGELHEIKVGNYLKEHIEMQSPKGLFQAPHLQLANSIQAKIKSPDLKLHGIPDFLLNVEGLRSLGIEREGFEGLEPLDAKLARTSKASAILQIAVYGEMLARMGYPRPMYGHLALGDSGQKGFKIETHRLLELYPLVNKLIEAYPDAKISLDKTWGARKPECQTCPFALWCANGRKEANDLTLVARMSSSLQAKLNAGGVQTVSDLSHAQLVSGVSPETFKRTQAQATLLEESKGLEKPLYQWANESNGHPSGALLMLEPGLRNEDGLLKDGTKGRLPQADSGDLFFDFEGFPYAPNGGLEYLFGWVDAKQKFSYLWADSEEQERQAFIDFVDFLGRHFKEHPQAHLYHYAAYEQTALKRLAEKYQTKEVEILNLLEAGRMVDLFKIVNSSLLVGVSSYSIKKLEPLYMPSDRSGEVTTSFGSVEAYYSYLNAQEDAKEKLKSEIIDYNTYDCVSTLELAAWLRERRPEALKEVQIPQEAPVRESSEKTLERRRLLAQLAENLSAHDAPYAEMLSLMVGYYQREAKVYWEEFSRKTLLSTQELSNDDDVVEVKSILEVRSIPKARSRALVRLEVELPNTLKGGVTLMGSGILGADVEDVKAGEFWVKADPTKLGELLKSRTLMQKAYISPGAKEEVIKLLAQSVLDSEEVTNAGFEVIMKTPLAYRSDASDITQGVVETVMGLPENGYFGVQGPPGAGKSRMAGQIITSALKAGWKVGVSCVAHKAIANLLEVVEELGIDTLKHAAGKSEEFEGTRDIRSWQLDSDATKVLGGTAYAWASLAKNVLEGSNDKVDLLVVDEASQMPLVDLISIASSARRIVFLGDPQQLAHVSQGEHEEKVDVSILGHLVGEEPVISQEHGFFLDQTWRFPTSVSKVVSALAYGGRLGSSDSTEDQNLDGLNGVFSELLDHQGCSTRSLEEANKIVELVKDLLGRTVMGLGPGKLLQASDILVVAPYNDQVRLLGETLAKAGYAEVQVGTVDKFQGQQAPVTIYSMTASNHDSGGRGSGFVLDVARLNVAISRTQTLAILVGSEGLTRGTGKVESLYQASRAWWLLSFPSWLKA